MRYIRLNGVVYEEMLSLNSNQVFNLICLVFRKGIKSLLLVLRILEMSYET